MLVMPSLRQIHSLTSGHMKKTFLFYDIETSGLNPVFDQIIQFAAIRTDLELNELERYEWVIRPNPETIPAPMAMITHRTPLLLWQQGEPELIVIQRIHTLFNTPGTISIGYNTLGFDDEFLRFSFYRNLLTPYTHQYANHCSRADLYPVTALYCLFHPEILIWPTQNGRISLKLDGLNQANHLSTGAAHTAIVDIEASITMAKNFMKHRDTWQYCLGYFDKKSDEERTLKLPLLLDKKFAIMIEGILGASQNFCAPVLQLGMHYHYKNQFCWLRLDTEDLSQSTLDNFIKNTWVINKKLAEPGFLLPPTEKYLAKLNGEKRVLLEKNIAWLHQHPEILQKITQHYLDYTHPKHSDIDPSAELYYQPFWTQEQQTKFQHFHRVSPEKKSAVIDTMRDPLLKILLSRALGRFDIHLLSDEQHELVDYSWSKYIDMPEKIIDHCGKQKLSLAQVLAEIQVLKTDVSLDSDQLKILDELDSWLTIDRCSVVAQKVQL